ncbi:Pentatricopeptide repeat, partial [Dillenia turbinata]
MLLSIAPNQQMGTIDFQRRPLVWSLNSQKPNCGFALNNRKVNRISTRQLNWRTITSALSDKVLDKEFGFKPSFNEYLKAMESVKHKSVNGSNNKFNRGSRTAEETPQSTRKRPESTEQRPFPSLGSFDVEGERKKLKNANELGSIKTKKEVARETLESEAVENVNPNVNGKEQVRDYSEIFGGGCESGQYNRVHRTLKESGAFKNVASIVNSEGQVSDYGENFRGVPENREYRMSQRNCKEEGYRNEIQKTGFPMANLDGKLDKREGENERHIEEEVELRNVKTSGSTRGLIRRGHDRYLEVERAAFRNIEEFTDFKGKPRLSRNEMEDRIQHLAKWKNSIGVEWGIPQFKALNEFIVDSLNGADINMPEWMFSKMMRSAKIRFCDHSILRIIQILGKLGNWRRVLQVIEWLQMRERYKSNKLRYIYTAALDVLKKARRPVEALNGQMSSYPDLVTYRCIAIALGQAGHIKELFDVIDTMRSMPKKKFNIGPLEKWDPRLEPDIVVYNAVLNACVKRKHWEGAFWVLQQLKQQGLKPCTSTYGLVMEVRHISSVFSFCLRFTVTSRIVQ